VNFIFSLEYEGHEIAVFLDSLAKSSSNTPLPLLIGQLSMKFHVIESQKLIQGEKQAIKESKSSHASKKRRNDTYL